MSRLAWGEGPRLFDQGVDQGVLYLGDSAVPWNGLVSVDEKETGSVSADYYFDGNRLWVTQETGDFEAAISAYTYPEVFSEYNGYSHKETYRRFGFSYRTNFGEGYKIHLVYNALVDDGSRSWKTVGATVDPSLFTWDVKASAVAIPGASPAARLTMEVGADPGTLSSIEDILYGTDTTDARLPDPAELYELYETATVLRITYNEDGSYTAIGPDSMVREIGDGEFVLDAPSVTLYKKGIFTASSY